MKPEDETPASGSANLPLMTRRETLALLSGMAALTATGYEMLDSISAEASVLYLTPCDRPISSSWQDHKNRTPPSKEPGTDYNAVSGTPVRCAEAGVVADVHDSPSGATGRYIAVNLDDGRRVRYLHLSSIRAASGSRVTRGQVIALSGASGFGSESGYGAHVHVSLWANPGDAIENTIDFERYADGNTSQNPPSNTQPDDTLKDPYMQTVVNTPNGTVVLISPAAKINFSSVDEYKAFRDQVNTLRNLAATTMMALPSLESVPNVSWDTYKFICKVNGVDPS